MFVRLTVLFFVCVLAGCRESVPEGDAFDPGVIRKEHLARGEEWRWARRVPGGTPKQVALGIVPAGGAAVRISTMAKFAAQSVRVDVVAGNRRVDSFVADSPILWTDRRADIGKEYAGLPCKAVFATDQDFWLSACEMADGTDAEPNVLIVLIDALRADQLGCYGNRRGTSPNIDRLAQDSVKFTQCFAQASWTRPSVSSLLTGTYPSTHGALDRDSVIRPGLPSIEAAMGRAGYETQSFIGNAMCLPIWGIGNSFNRVVNIPKEAHGKVDDARVIDAAMTAIDNCASRRWFMYVHLIGPHNPYLAPEPFASKFKTPDSDGDNVQRDIDLYDAEVANTDSHVGRLLDLLRDSGLYDRTMIVLMSDHGTQFYEHGAWGHGQSLYDEEIRIPMIVKLPESAHAGAVRDDLIEQVDLAPTILAIVGAQPEPRFQGRSLVDVFKGNPIDKEYIYASLQLEKNSMYTTRGKSIKFIRDLVSGRKLWFNLEADPRETSPLDESQAAALPGAAELEQYARKVAAMESQGLNLLITMGQGDAQVVSGRVRGKGLCEPIVNFHQAHYEMRREQDGYAFIIKLAESRGIVGGGAEWHSAVQQEGVQIRFSVDEDAVVSLEVQADGQPIPAANIFVGPVKDKRPLGGTCTPGQIVADPTEFDPLLLERKLAAYAWYVPQAGRLEDKDLPPEIKDTLEALGYLE